MSKRQVTIAIILTVAIVVYIPCIIVYGSSYVWEFFDDAAGLYQINKSVVWAVVISFIITLMLAKIIVMVNIDKRRNAETFLLGNEEIFSALINGTPDLIFFKDAEGRYLEINDSMLQLFGFDAEHYKGMKGHELAEESPLYKGIFEGCFAKDDKAWEKGSTYKTIEILEMPNGAKRIYDVIKAPIFYEDGRRKGIVTLARDITTHKEAERKLEKKRNILRATLNATDDGILVVDNNRQVLEANDLFLRMWDIPWELFALNNEIAILKYIKKQLVDFDAFEDHVNYTYEVPVTENFIVNFKDGRIYNLFSTPLMDEGQMIGRVWSTRNITARVNAENELQKSEERYRTLVELSPDAIFVSVDGRILFTNMAGVKIFGANSREELNQIDIMDFVHPDTKALTEQYINDIINGKENLSTFEHKFVRRDGKCIDIESVCSRVPYRGESAVMSVVRDISERKRAEETKYKMEEDMKLLRETIEYDKIKTEFFANISHEVKTPLNIIIGTLQLFELMLSNNKGHEDSDKLIKYMSIMRQNCFRLLRMLNNLVYTTEIDSGFVDIHFQNCDLVQIVKGITSPAAIFIENKGIKLNLNAEDISLEMACDADKIERVILNLLSNAVKFTEEGDEISVSLYSDKDYAYISVKDTGIGIPDEMKNLIFQRFRQVDKSFTRRCEGSGIGLSLAKSLVEMHKGSIEVQSEYGKGSEFIVKLPLWLIDEDEIAVAAEGAASVCLDKVHIEFSDIY